MVEESGAGEASTYQDQPINYFVPLRWFEKSMLKDVQLILDKYGGQSDNNQSASVNEAFCRWNWADKVKGVMKDFLGDKSIQTDFQGARSKAYIGLMQFFVPGQVPDENLARSNHIKEVNPDFISKLGNRPIDTIVVSPFEQDLPSWRTIARMLPFCLHYLEQLKSLSNPRSTFEIPRLVKVFMLGWNLPLNRSKVLESFMNSTIFRTSYTVEVEDAELAGTTFADLANLQSVMEAMTICPHEVDDVQLSITKRRTNNREVWPKNEVKYSEDGKMTKGFLNYALREMGQQQKLADPRYYVHFIDWTDLKSMTEAELRQANINTNIPFVQQDETKKWFVWTPNCEGFAWNHHLYTEDEVFEYNMTQWPLPDHYLKNQVIFQAREISETDFVGDLRAFWEAWNDCAITRTSDESPLLLLETIPGMRFRSRRKYQDQKSAIIYFRNLVEAHASEALDTQYLRDLLGLEATFTPVFEHSLRLIPEKELSGIEWDIPLGRGANGVVYSGIWHRPHGVLSTTNAAKSNIPVVLKDVASRADNSISSRKKLIKELDLAFSSLGGLAACCVSFLGVATLRRSDDRSGQSADEKLFLVLERATQGDILNFLLRHLNPLDFLTSWDTIVTALGSIGTGICNLHDHKVLHRDLHMNNILVTDNYIAHDFRYPHEYKYLISDVGEGKILREGVEIQYPSNHLASYGAVEFRAPEVYGGEGWTPKAEVFSFGVIATKVIQARRVACAAEPPSWIRNSVLDVGKLIKPVELVPVAFKRAIERCLQFSPEDRPTLREVVLQLDDLSDDFLPVTNSDAGSLNDHADNMIPSPETNEEEPLDIEWTYWDWKNALQLARRPKDGLGGRLDRVGESLNARLRGVSQMPTLR